MCIQKYGFLQIKNNMCSKISMNFIEPGTVIDLQFELPGGVGGVWNIHSNISIIIMVK